MFQKICPSFGIKIERERERVNGAQKLENKKVFNYGQKIFICLLVFVFGLGFGAKTCRATGRIADDAAGYNHIFVDTDVVGGSANGTSWVNAYSGFVAMEAAEDGVALTANTVVHLRGATDDVLAAVPATVDGWTLGAYTLTIQGNANGVWNDSAYTMKRTPAADSELVLRLYTNVKIVGIQVDIDNSGAKSGVSGILSDFPSSAHWVDSCIIRLVGNPTTTTTGYGIYLSKVNGGGAINNIVYGPFRKGISTGDIRDGGFITIANNLTTGITDDSFPSGDADSTRVYNNISYNNTRNYTNGQTLNDAHNNATNETRAITPSAASVPTSYAVHGVVSADFVNAVAYDFTPSSTSRLLKSGDGTGCSSIFTHDATGSQRPSTLGDWDIGPIQAPWPALANILPADDGTANGLSPTLSVDITDSAAQTSTVKFYGRVKPANTTSFTVVIIPDTQYYANDDNANWANKSGTYAPTNYVPDIFPDQLDWIVANKDALNIAYVGHTGDIVNGGAAAEFTWANTQMSKLDGVAPWSVAPGNNDGTSPFAEFNVAFPHTRFDTAPDYDWYGGNLDYVTFTSGGTTEILVGNTVSNNGQTATVQAVYLSGGTWAGGNAAGTIFFSGKTGAFAAGALMVGGVDLATIAANSVSRNEGSFQLWSASGIDFITINVPYNPGAAITQWANQLLQTYSTRVGLYLTHSLLNTDGSWYATSGAQAQYDALKGNTNLLAMFCGHYGLTKTRIDTYGGHDIYTMMFDAQDFTNGGNGYLRMLEFKPGENKVSVKTFSTISNTYMTENDNQFDISWVAPGVFTQIGSDQAGVASGTPVTQEWANLTDKNIYQWYFTTDNGDAVTPSEIYEFDVDANATPSVPTLVSPVNASSTDDTTPTLSALYSDSNTGDTGTVEYRISNIDASDCTSGGAGVVSSGSSSTTASNSETTTWTPSSSIGSDTAYYWCARANDGIATSSWTSMGSFTLDTTAPTISAVTSTPTSTGTTIAWTTNENSSSKINYGLTNSYGNSTTETNTSPRVSNHSVSLSSLVACSTYHYRVRSIDAATNETIDSDNTFITTGCTGSDSIDSQATSNITIVSGGSVNLLTDSKGITLTVPTSFAGSDANFQIKQLDKTATINTTSTPTGYSAIGSYVYELSALSDVSTKITTFNNALTISIAYASSDVSGIDESTLKIYRWDGSVWNQLSGCSVYTSTKTVTCTTTNFSTFVLFGQASSSGSSNSSSSSSTNSSSVCNDQAPGAKAPWLYGAIAQDSGSVLLYFTEADNPVNKYVLEYGTKSGNYPYGVQDMGVNSRGQMTFLVKSLSSYTTYYFRVRGGNGCATGSWSNEISIKTKGLVSFNQLEITESELEAKPVRETSQNETCQTYTVKSGDSLWSIAKNLLGDGSKYEEIIEQNKKEYLSFETSNNIKTGWELKVNCERQILDEETKKIEPEEQDGYDVKVKVVDTNKKPVEGAKVTIHSKVQEALTNEYGIAEFKNVEPGDHKVLIAYNNYEGKQSVNLTGDVKEFDLNLTIQQKAISLSPLAFGIIGIMGLVIIVLAILLFKLRNTRK